MEKISKIKEFFNSKAEIWDQREINSPKFFDEFVSSKMHLKKGMKVLDLACGTGIITNSIYKITQTNVLGLDLSDKMIEKAKLKNQNVKINFLSGDFYEFEGEKFDAIICHNAYPHFLDKLAFKKKSYELLNEDGILVICHSFSREKVNALHHRPNMIESNETLEGKLEANFYSDLFEVLEIEDDDIYNIVLKKKS